jgi:hypothetical protein
MTPDEHQALGRRIAARYDKMIADAEQLIRDCDAWNGANPQHPPFDVEADRIYLAELRKCREMFLSGRSREIDMARLLVAADEAVAYGEANPPQAR